MQVRGDFLRPPVTIFGYAFEVLSVTLFSKISISKKATTVEIFIVLVWSFLLPVCNLPV